jgi:hypothetical protein
VTVTGTYKTQYQVTFEEDPDGGGTITPTTGWYDAGDWHIEATPISPTDLFLNWSASNPSITFSNSIEPSTTATIDGSGTIVAHFAEPKEITITSSPVGVDVIVDGDLLTTPQTFTWGKGTGHNINALSPFPVGEIRYYFTDWSDGGAQSHQYIVNDPDTVFANYKKQCKIRFEVFGSGRLKVNGAEVTAPVELWYDDGAVISLEGSPAGKFIGWGGTLTVVPNPAKPYEATHTVSMSGTIYLITK